MREGAPKGKPIENKHPELQTEKDIEDFMRKHWAKHQADCHEDDCMTFVEYIGNCDFLLANTGWYWDADNYMFRKIEEDL